MAYTFVSETVEAVRYLGEAAVVTAFAGEACEVVDGQVNIITPGGRTPCAIGDWVIKFSDDRFYPVNPKLFAAILA